MTSSNYLGCLVFLCALGGASAHSYLFEPPSRNYVAQKAGKENCAHCLQANGPDAVKARGNGKWPSVNDPKSHGLCGEPVQHTPEVPELKDQKYMKAEFVNEPQRTYRAGDLVTFKVAVSAHHMGHYEFRICDRNMNADTIASAAEGQECLNKVLLKKAPRNAQHCGNDYTGDCQRDNPKHPERWYVPPPGTKYTARGDSANWNDAEGAKPIGDISWEQYSGKADVHTMTYVIPTDLQCTHCTLQWYLSTGWVCAYDKDYFDHDPGNGDFKFWAHYGAKTWWDGYMCGYGERNQFPEEFWNCADIAVLAATGGPTPPASPTPPAPTLPTPGKKPEPEPEPEGNKTEPEPEPEGNKTKAEPEPEPEGNKTKPEPEPESEPEPIPASSKKLYNQVDGNNDGVLTPAEFAFWSQARGVVAKACQDDADFKDPLGYSCADWDGYCFTKLLDYASDYTPQDILSIIYNCPKTCDESCKEGALLESNLHDGHRVGLVRRAEF